MQYNVYLAISIISSKGNLGGPILISAANKLNSYFIAFTHSPNIKQTKISQLQALSKKKIICLPLFKISLTLEFSCD